MYPFKLKALRIQRYKLRIPENGTMNDRPFLNTLTTIPKKTLSLGKKGNRLNVFFAFPPEFYRNKVLY